MKNTIIIILTVLLLISAFYNYKCYGPGDEKASTTTTVKEGTKPFTIELGKDSIEVYFYDASLGGDSSAFNGYNTYASMTTPTGACDNFQPNTMVCGKISVPGGVVVNPTDLFKNVLPRFQQIGIGMRVRRGGATNQLGQYK